MVTDTRIKLMGLIEALNLRLSTPKALPSTFAPLRFESVALGDSRCGIHASEETLSTLRPNLVGKRLAQTIHSCVLAATFRRAWASCLIA